MRTSLRAAIAAMAITMLAPFGARADLAPLQVFTDATLDAPTTAEATPPPQDLVAGYIAETADTIDFTWKAVDMPAVPGGVPELFVWYWEFTLDAPGPNPPQAFSLRARAVTVPGVRGGGSLQGNCTNTGGLIQCTPVPGSVVTVSFDSEADTVTAKVRRSDLKGADGNSAAVDGAVLVEIDIFDGISACTTFVAVVLSLMCDGADMDDVYVLGTPRP